MWKLAQDLPQPKAMFVVPPGKGTAALFRGSFGDASVEAAAEVFAIADMMSAIAEEKRIGVRVREKQ